MPARTHYLIRFAIAALSGPILSTGAFCAAAEEVGSPFPAAMEAATDPVRPGESDAARVERLLAGLERAPVGDPMQDGNCLEVGEKTQPASAQAERLAARCDAEALRRLVRTGAAKHQYRAVRLLGDEYLKRQDGGPESNGAETAEMANAAATAHMVLDPTPDRAVRLWAQAAQTGRETPDGLAGRVHLEAVTGPQSVAAMEAAGAMAKLQAGYGASRFRAELAARRVIESAQRPFFAAYLASPAVEARDKAEMLYQVVYHAGTAGETALVRSAAGQVFGLVGYDDVYAERSALAVAGSHQLDGNHADAAAHFEAFVQAFPNSEKAPDASYLCARNLQLGGRTEDALVQYEVTIRLFPASPAAARAAHARDNLVRTDPEARSLALDSARMDAALAAMSQPPDFAAVWPPSPLPARPPAPGGLPPDLGGVARPADPAGVAPEHRRLSSVLTGVAKGGN